MSLEVRNLAELAILCEAIRDEKLYFACVFCLFVLCGTIVILIVNCELYFIVYLIANIIVKESINNRILCFTERLSSDWSTRVRWGTLCHGPSLAADHFQHIKITACISTNNIYIH